MEPQKQTDPKNTAPICHESEPLPAGKLPYTGNLFKIPALLLGAFSVLLCYHLTVYALIAGILADWVNGGTVENCYTSGKIENNVGNKFVGGLIGQCTWSTQVKGCGSDATVISTDRL